MSFSETGKEEIKRDDRSLCGQLPLCIGSIVEGSRDKALKVIEKETKADDLEIRVFASNISTFDKQSVQYRGGSCILRYDYLPGAYFRSCKKYCRRSIGTDGIRVEKQVGATLLFYLIVNFSFCQEIVYNV
mgnify:CR=1 FL=1